MKMFVCDSLLFMHM